MKKVNFIFLICFIGFYSAQKTSFVYELKYRFGSHNDSLASINMILDFNDNISVFRTEKEKRSDSLLNVSRFGIGADQNIEGQIYVTKDLKNKDVKRNYRTRFNDYYDVKIENKIIWKIESDRDKIGGFDVQKAVTDYGGRKWIVWFTTEIPITDGPYIFNGLPGLIVRATDSDKDYDFILVAIKNTSGNLFLRKKGLDMDFSHFKKLMMQYYNDPYADLKLRNMLPVYTSDGHGGKKALDLNELTKKTQKMIREQNNPIEIDYKNDYK